MATRVPGLGAVALRGAVLRLAVCFRAQAQSVQSHHGQCEYEDLVGLSDRSWSACDELQRCKARQKKVAATDRLNVAIQTFVSLPDR